jgi:hypothetical protein
VRTIKTFLIKIEDLGIIADVSDEPSFIYVQDRPKRDISQKT